jgi:2-polyprenyl-3-methyl-5-hydroxy-6-metoxy-1,4-benzoquinol methylase
MGSGPRIGKAPLPTRERASALLAEDLTTAEFWDDVYTAPLAPVRRWRRWINRRAQQAIDAMWCHLIDAAGKEELEILEIGCAPGSLLERIHSLRPQHRLHGIDYATRGVERTRQRLRELGIEATVQQGDIRSADLRRKYDLVLSFGLIEHFTDPSAMIGYHARAAVPGGQVVVTVPNYTRPAAQRALIQRIAPETFQFHNASIMTPGALREALEAAGLQQIEVGTAGGPQLRTDGHAVGAIARGCRSAARLWNLVVAALPATHRLWGCHIWGIGRVGAANE